MVCSIFIASSHSNGCPCLTLSPTCTPTRITVPGIGASNDPAATCCDGSVNRSTGVNATDPSDESTHTSPS